LKRALVLKRFSRRNEFSKLADQLYLQLLVQNIETILNWHVNLRKNYSKPPRLDETYSVDKIEQLFSKKDHEKYRPLLKPPRNLGIFENSLGFSSPTELNPS